MPLLCLIMLVGLCAPALASTAFYPQTENEDNATTNPLIIRVPANTLINNTTYYVKIVPKIIGSPTSTGYTRLRVLTPDYLHCE
jgi:hypothetical protein